MLYKVVMAIAMFAAVKVEALPITVLNAQADKDHVTTTAALEPTVTELIAEISKMKMQLATFAKMMDGLTPLTI